MYPTFVTIGELYLYPAVVIIQNIYFGAIMQHKQRTRLVSRAALYVNRTAENNGLVMIIKIMHLPV